MATSQTDRAVPGDRPQVRRGRPQGALPGERGRLPDGQLLATGWEGRIVFWGLPAGRELFALAAHAAKDGEKRDVQVLGVAFSPGGAELASAGYDGTVRFWGVAGRQQVGS